MEAVVEAVDGVTIIDTDHVIDRTHEMEEDPVVDLHMTIIAAMREVVSNKKDLIKDSTGKHQHKIEITSIIILNVFNVFDKYP